MPVQIFFCYALEDKLLRDQLEKHLMNMKRQGLISSWHDHEISAGQDWKNEIDNLLNTSDIILLLVSPDFMYSEYCYDIVMKTVLKKHFDEKARVIPVILRPTDWQDSPFSSLQVLPANSMPVRSWVDPDDAFLDIARGIRKVIAEVLSEKEIRETASSQKAAVDQITLLVKQVVREIEIANFQTKIKLKLRNLQLIVETYDNELERIEKLDLPDNLRQYWRRRLTESLMRDIAFIQMEE